MLYPPAWPKESGRLSEFGNSDTIKLQDGNVVRRIVPLPFIFLFGAIRLYAVF